jgi:ribosomal protein L32
MVPHRVCKACGHYDGREVVKKGDAEQPTNG